MGVSRAVELALNLPRRFQGPFYTYGPLIHNPQVLNLLEEKEISAIDEIPEHGEGTLLIRAHGVPPQAKARLEEAGFNVLDATCPRVIKVQTIISHHSRQGYASIIIGDRNHPEVIGLQGFAGENAYVVDNIKDLSNLPVFRNAIIVAQTTQNTLFFESIKSWAEAYFPHYKIFDTICDSTAKRQEEVKQLACSVDAVVVVGGYNSGNTKRLAEIVRQQGKPAFHIETENELDLNGLKSFRRIGLTAGASTPNWIIKEIRRAIENL